jgi:hypothetical protein
VDGKELREAVMNKFVRYYSFIAEIRPDRKWRWIAKLDPFRTYQSGWTKDGEGEANCWDYYIQTGEAKVINIDQWVEENFENLL